MKYLLLVFLGGGLGSSLRYFISSQLNTENVLPYGTLLVNIAGSFVIGAILGHVLKNETLNQGTVLFLAAGFCGGFTTFSAFAFENFQYLREGAYAQFATYTIGSLVLGVAAVFVGIMAVRAL